MAAAPRYKLFNPKGKYMASAKEPELLAACIGLLGAGSTIRDGRNLKLILWTEGDSTQDPGDEGGDGIAYESYDVCATTCYRRQDPRWID